MNHFLRGCSLGLAAVSFASSIPAQVQQAATPVESLERAPLRVANPQRRTFVPGEILIRYAAGADAASPAARAIEAENGLARLQTNDTLSVHRYRLPAGVTVAQALARLRNDNRVEYVEPNMLYELHQVPNDSFYDNYQGTATDLQKWAFDGIGGDSNVNAEAAWDITTGRSDVVIAVIDSGVDLDHPDIAGNLWTNPGEIPGNGNDDDGNGFTDDVNGWDFESNDSNPNPDLGDGFDNDGNGAADDNTFHGTFAGSCAGGVGNNGTGMTGAAWDCQLMAIKIFTDDGGASVFDIANGITYAANNGADVLNMSFGGGFSSTVQSAVNFAHSAGCVQVASAGNGNSSAVQYPSGLNFVISVGSTDSGSVAFGGTGDIDGRSSFSQYGTNAVDVVAPGSLLVGAAVNAVADGNAGSATWFVASGTSFSGPLVAGLAALVISRSRDVGAGLDNDDVEAIIQNNTIDLPDDPNDSPNGGANWDGLGRVDFLAAVNAVQGGGPVNNPPVAVAGSNQSGLVGDAFSFDGLSSFDPDGDPIVSYSWTFGDGGSSSSTNPVHVYNSAGSYTVSLTVSDGSLTGSDSLTVTVSDPPMGGTSIYMVNNNNISLSGLGTLANEDVFIYDTGTGNYTLFVDGSDVGLGGAAIDGFALLAGGDMLISLRQPFSVPGLVGGPSGTSVDDSDVLLFSPSSTGANTSGVFTFYFDGSDVGLTSNGEDIDGLSVDSNGDLIFSTHGGFGVTGLSGADEDVIRFSPTNLGSTTSGTWTRIMDGSDVGMGGNSNEDIRAVHFTNGDIYLSVLGDFAVPGLSGADEDVFVFSPTSLGNTTAGSFSAFFDGSVSGYPTADDVRAVHIE